MNDSDMRPCEHGLMQCLKCGQDGRKPSLVLLAPVVELHPASSPPNQAIVNLLCALLERAKEGEIRAIALTTALGDGSIGGAFEDGGGGYTGDLVFGIEVVKRNLMEEVG